MGIDTRFDPEQNAILEGLLKDAGFEGTDRQDAPWGAYFLTRTGLFAILNAKGNTTVHDHPKHRPGVIHFVGGIIQGNEDLTDQLRYTVQVDRGITRIPGAVENLPGPKDRAVYLLLSGVRPS